MVTKEEVEARVEEGSSTFFHAGVSLHRALMDIETQHFEDSVDDLRACREYLDDAIDAYRIVIEHAGEGLLGAGDGEVPPSALLDYDALWQKGRLEGLFFEDEELWEYVAGAAEMGDPLAGYERILSLMTRVRNDVDGLVADIESGQPPEHVQHATWRTMTRYMRTVTLGHMIAFANTEALKRRPDVEGP